MKLFNNYVLIFRFRGCSGPENQKVNKTEPASEEVFGKRDPGIRKYSTAEMFLLAVQSPTGAPGQDTLGMGSKGSDI